MKLYNILFLYFVCYIPILFITSIMPYVTRKTENFGISIPSEIFEDEKVKALRKDYRNKVLLFGGVFSLLALIFGIFYPEDIKYVILTAGTFVLLFISFFFYLKAHKVMKKLKAENNWTASKSEIIMVATDFRNKKIIMSPLWFLLNISIIIITLLIGFACYDKIPDKVPMGWNINGKVHTWSQKSYKLLFFPAVTQLVMTATMAFTYWIIGKAKQMVDPSSPEKSIEQNRLFRYRWSGFIIFTNLALNIMFGLFLFPMTGAVTNPVIIMGVPAIITIAILVAVIILSITTGQGGSRISKISVKSKDESRVISREEDKYWKLGMFYYNPDDPSLFVEKRFGIGWTNNWAKPLSWVLVLGLLVIIIGASFASVLLVK